MSLNILVIHGPNLNLLGKREPEVYGSETFDSYFEKLQIQFPNITLEYFQSNIEGELIEITYFFAFIKTPNSGTLTIPNALFLKSSFRLLEKSSKSEY